MNVTRETIDSLRGTIKIEVVKADYASAVDKTLKEYQRKSTIPGFRKGNTPLGIIKKMYGKTVLMEELNKLVPESLSTYLEENNLNLLFRPLPSREHGEIDLNADDFEFYYDIVYTPEWNVKLSKREKIPYYTIKIDDEMLDEQSE
jgi:trigger factor